MAFARSSGGTYFPNECRGVKVTFEEMPPVMRELFNMLPPPGSEWPLIERLRWMRAMEAICRLVFKDDIALSVLPETGSVT